MYTKTFTYRYTHVPYEYSYTYIDILVRTHAPKHAFLLHWYYRVAPGSCVRTFASVNICIYVSIVYICIRFQCEYLYIRVWKNTNINTIYHMNSHIWTCTHIVFSASLSHKIGVDYRLLSTAVGTVYMRLMEHKCMRKLDSTWILWTALGTSFMWLMASHAARTCLEQ